MSEKALDSAIDELAAACDDMEREGFDASQAGFARLEAILNTESLAGFLRAVLPEFDFVSWWSKGRGETRYTSGQPQLVWPAGLVERIAARIALCRHAARDPMGVTDYMFRKLEDRPLRSSYLELLGQVVQPLIRDLRVLAKRRVAPLALDPVLEELCLATGDADLDRLLQEAVEGFRAPDPATRRGALEKIWDAFERVKTMLDPGDKRRSSTKLVDAVAGTDEFRRVVEDEMRALTAIGNMFHIRHHETGEIPLTGADEIDYLFHRCAATVHLLLGTLTRIGFRPSP